jgi:hypothetical protein
MLPHLVNGKSNDPAQNWVISRLNAKLHTKHKPSVWTRALIKDIKRYQQMMGLKPDGVVGPGTQAALGGKDRPILALNIMRGFVGLSEDSQNRVDELVAYAREHTDWSPSVSGMGFSWCNYVVSLCHVVAETNLGRAVSGTWSGYTGMYVPATVQKLKYLAYHNQAEQVTFREAMPGDIVIYAFSGTPDHIGLVDGKASYALPTVEGNTSSSNFGSQDNGDGVYRKKRYNHIHSIWRTT